jgi:hypothetical protein
MSQTYTSLIVFTDKECTANTTVSERISFEGHYSKNTLYSDLDSKRITSVSRKYFQPVF